ncbi:Protein transport protein SEC24 [Zancudomyces culisetae]|uniref:Protein transport protein SEC24 n=1 Tax=Zancudomyces culisetae TaxID=1213189 RepID=A0A1R1PUX9_ZANCU|nr:Protein transport protein SEC24 [Zancudomyces culisetae]|eukprot:OMH84760.1 Protein transport protein SEC24 [Zancudomyces culisetae]
MEHPRPSKPQISEDLVPKRKESPFSGTTPLTQVHSRSQSPVINAPSTILKPQAVSGQVGFGARPRPVVAQPVPTQQSPAQPIIAQNQPIVGGPNRGITQRPGFTNPQTQPPMNRPGVAVPQRPHMMSPQTQPPVVRPAVVAPQRPNMTGIQNQPPVARPAHQPGYQSPNMAQQQSQLMTGGAQAISPRMQHAQAAGHDKSGSRRRQYPQQQPMVYDQTAMYGTQPAPAKAKEGLPKHIDATAGPRKPDLATEPFSVSEGDFFVPGDKSGAIKAVAPPAGMGRRESPLSTMDSRQMYSNMTSSPMPRVPVAEQQAAMTQQFANMGFGGGYQDMQMSTVLVGHPQIQELDAPPPQATLPQGLPCCPSENYQCPPEYARCTLNAIPKTDKLLKKSKLPFGVLFTPYLTQEDIPGPPAIMEIVRCRRCRSYINPFISFTEGGRRWKCNLCDLVNDIPLYFDYDSIQNVPVNRWERTDITHSVIEFVAPADYMVRPPMPPVYFFIIDVSNPAVQLNVPEVVGNVLLECLDAIPNSDERAKVGFITVDSSIHFYLLNPESTEPHMLVLSDFDSPFLPSPSDLLVNLHECRPAIESLLTKMGDMFRKNVSVGNALGPAILAAQQLLAPIGGKIIVMQSSVPTIGEAAITVRDDRKGLGTPAESELLKPQNSWYKNIAAECSRSQIAFDTIFFGQQSLEIQTVSCLARYTGGSIFFYPSFIGTREPEVERFKNELLNHLGSVIALEAVFRVRASRGIRLSSYYGHFFLRSLDLLSLPNVIPNHCYAVEAGIEEDLNVPVVYFQSALLHTTVNSERRIRVITMAIPTTENIHNVFQNADQLAIAAFLAKKAADRAMVTKLEDAREALQYKCLEILSTYKQECTQSSSGATTQLKVPRNLQLLPFLTLATLKHPALRSGNTIPISTRINALSLFTTLSPELLLSPYIIPKLYTLQPGEDYDSCIVPVYPSAESLSINSVNLLVSGPDIFIWVGRDPDPSLLHSLFGVQDSRAINPGLFILPKLDYLSHKLNGFVHQLYLKLQLASRGLWSPVTYICRENSEPALKLWFYQQLTLDRDPVTPSYQQYLIEIRDKINKGNI